jgi:CubicO group peptidase (beta-lactamase class C family)
MNPPLIEKIALEQRIPGLAVGIQAKEQVVFEQYYGDANLEHHAPVSSETVFEIASVSKLFTAQAIMVLAEQGKLQLDDPIANYIKDLPVAWQSVTIRHCLAHQSGLPGYTDVKEYWQRTRHSKSHEKVIDLVRHLPLTFPSGTSYAYDNTGFYLLGMVIEAVTKHSYGDYLAEIIFKPLSMSQTRANNYEQIIPHRAQGYVLREGVLYNKDYYDVSNTFSAGVFLSTVQDLLRWSSSLYSNDVLNAQSRQQWWRPHPSQTGNERELHFTVALGWFMLDLPVGSFLGHNGGILGFASSFIHFREQRITAVVLCNASHVEEPHEIALKVIQDLQLL